VMVVAVVEEEIKSLFLDDDSGGGGGGGGGYQIHVSHSKSKSKKNFDGRNPNYTDNNFNKVSPPNTDCWLILDGKWWCCTGGGGGVVGVGVGVLLLILVVK
ncbi:hypothetical protein C5167_023973, partial [Papaver somniferum]